jgi:hypothetical protein
VPSPGVNSVISKSAMTALPCGAPVLCPVSRLPLRPVSRSDDAIIEIKFESRFNGLDESRVNVSTAVFC